MKVLLIASVLMLGTAANAGICRDQRGPYYFFTKAAAERACSRMYMAEVRYDVGYKKYFCSCDYGGRGGAHQGSEGGGSTGHGGPR